MEHGTFLSGVSLQEENAEFFVTDASFFGRIRETKNSAFRLKERLWRQGPELNGATGFG